jgi:hypothetical protein
MQHHCPPSHIHYESSIKNTIIEIFLHCFMTWRNFYVAFACETRLGPSQACTPAPGGEEGQSGSTMTPMTWQPARQGSTAAVQTADKKHCTVNPVNSLLMMAVMWVMLRSVPPYCVVGVVGTVPYTIRKRSGPGWYPGRKWAVRGASCEDYGAPTPPAYLSYASTSSTS